MFKFPFTNFHELNLDWVLSVVKTAQAIFETGRTDIDYAVSTADEAKEIATQAASATIADNSVSTSKLQDGAVTHTKLANNAVEGNNIKNRSITGDHIGENTITNYNIENGSLLGADLAANTIEGANIAFNTIPITKLTTDVQNLLSKIDNIEIGTITKNDRINGGTLDNVTCYKNGNTVFCSARLFNISETASGIFFDIPEGFRPRRSQRISGFIDVNNVTIPLMVGIEPNGHVVIAYSASKTLTQIGVVGSYTLL